MLSEGIYKAPLQNESYYVSNYVVLHTAVEPPDSVCTPRTTYLSCFSSAGSCILSPPPKCFCLGALGIIVFTETVLEAHTMDGHETRHRSYRAIPYACECTGPETHFEPQPAA